MDSTITDEEWARLPLRARLLINAGFVDPEECIKRWREYWRKQDELAEGGADEYQNWN